jgi:hypothetical protein
MKAIRVGERDEWIEPSLTSQKSDAKVCDTRIASDMLVIGTVHELVSRIHEFVLASLQFPFRSKFRSNRPGTVGRFLAPREKCSDKAHRAGRQFSRRKQLARSVRPRTVYRSFDHVVACRRRAQLCAATAPPSNGSIARSAAPLKAPPVSLGP